MSKHSTTPRTLSRRLAALLAALALLAAMALPVYAETLDGATQMQETVETDNNGETDNNVEKGSDVETDDKSETKADTGTGTESEDTNDNASPNPGANSTTQADNDPADAPDGQDPAAPDTAVAPNPAADAEEPAAETTTAEQDVLFADGGNTDVTAPATSGYTLYFIAPTNWEENLSKADAHLYLNVNFHDKEWQQVDMTQIGNTATDCRLYAINFVPRIDYATICTCQFQCYVGKDHKAQFQPISNTTTELTSLVGRVFDGTTDAWSDYQKEYAGKTLYFKNDSTAELTSVKAVFYTWDWQSKTCKQVAEQEVGTVAAGTQSEVQIPQTASGFVRFTWANGQSALYNYSNIQYTAENESTPLNITTKNCFIYGAEGSGTWDKVSNNVLAAGKTIYFDSTFSSYTYAGEESAIHQNAMPESRNGGTGKIYCFLQTANGSVDTVEMTSATDPKAPDPTAPGRQLWFYNIPKDKSYTAVQFSAWNDRNRTAKDDMTKLWSEDDIPANLKEPCFFADNGDPSAYKDGDVCREGYWGEKASVRDAESGKNKTGKNNPVVDIASEKFTQEPGTKYITSTLYDYYTDYELNGFNRDDYPDGNTISQRGFVTFEQFNRALSSAYAANKNVKYPLYTGHFQPSINGWGNFFAAVAPGMGLYGWDEVGTPAYTTFMAVNNSALDTKAYETDGNYARTFQGLVEDKTSDGTKDGLPLLKRKDEQNSAALVDPHFNKDFLQGKNAFNTVLGKVYEDVSFPLKKEKVFANTPNNSGNNAINDAEYWYFDSNETSLYLKQDSTEGYFLAGSGTKETSRNRGSDNKTNETANKKFGFFPFNQTVGDNDSAPQYNYGFSAKLQFDFTLTENGQVTVGQNGKTVPIQFFFSGDDDVWVYIDGELVLDVGGAHDRAAGLLEFGSDENGNTVTSWVSDTKVSGRVYKEQKQPKKVKFTNKHNISNDYTFKYKTEKPKSLKDKPIHTLTMFYMERGMWESNMALAFNFPDHNELQVEKKVDVSGVNELFQKSFLDQKIFTFNIQNLATHYGTKETTTPKIETETLPDTAYSSATKPLKHVTTPPVDANKDRAVLWKSDVKDPTSEHRDKRRGTLAWDTAIDITKYSYLTFDVYVQGESTETCALSNLYVELWDTGGKQMGCLDKKGLRSSDVYGAATALHPGTWYTVRLMLNSLQKDAKFNNQVTKITVGDNYARSIYLRNFTFSSAPAMPEQKGFTTAQYDIPDYGSAETGTLQNAAYAVFSSSDGTGNVVNENGDFLLEAGETVTFNDQFRRGSYIALKELTDTELYDTSWTVYENGVPVTTVSGNPKVVTVSDNRSLQNVKGTTPNDGRTEKVVADGELDGHPIPNAYKTTDQKPNADTLVFRSYSDKADENELTKLKVVFTNKVKTGKLIIRKVPAKDETLKDQEFTFTVQFGDVGGQSLGEEIKPQTYTCKVRDHGADGYYGEIVIDKIPVGTRFVVSEDAHKGTNLQSVSFTGGEDCAVTEDGKRVRGAIAEGDDKAVTATFVNTSRQLIDIEVTKQWKKQNGTTDIQSNELPKAIYLKLQRTETPTDPDNWQNVPGYECVELKPQDYKGWTKLFTGLDKYDANKEANKRVYYSYRVLESATKGGTFYGGPKDNVIEIDGKKYTILNNTVQVEESSKSPLALTLTNQLQDAKYNLVITKQDAQDTKIKLGGVEFKLEKLGTDGKLDKTFATVTEITSSEDTNKGECRFEDLTPGSYRLTETKTAEGYTLLADAIEFTLTTDGHCVRDGVGFGEVVYDTATGVYNIALTINNRKSFELPHTGADAPSLWLLIGLPLAVAGLLILVFRYNKKGGRTR